MSPLDKVYYSRGGCIAAVRDYCSFLRNMYLDESLVLELSEGGWRNVKAENIPGFDETDEVFALLGHLSYIDSGSDRIAHGNSCYFLADWQVLAGNDPNEDAQDLKLATEEDFDDEAPAPVVRLTNSDNILSFILLDTELGIVHWRVCPHEWRYNLTREQITDSLDDYAPDEERRGDVSAWAVANSFQNPQGSSPGP